MVEPAPHHEAHRSVSQKNRKTCSGPAWTTTDRRRWYGNSGNERSRRRNRAGKIGDRSIELLLVHRAQDFAHFWTWSYAELKQVATEENRPGWLMLDTERTGAFQEPVHRLAIECTGA